MAGRLLAEVPRTAVGRGMGGQHRSSQKGSRSHKGNRKKTLNRSGRENSVGNRPNVSPHDSGGGGPYRVSRGADPGSAKDPGLLAMMVQKANWAEGSRGLSG